MHPLDGAVRGQARSGTVQGLFAELGGGTVTHSALQLGLALAGLFAGVSIVSINAGSGMIWVSRGRGDDQLVMLGASEKSEPAIV